MSCRVISKLRCYNPSLKNTTNGNIKHLYYISDRSNAMFNENNSSVFGYINYNEIENVIDKNDVARHIKKMSNNKTNIYRGIISLKEEDSIRLGITTKKDFEKILNESIRDIAKIMNIPFFNAEYVGVVHYKKGNPHIHYMLWNNNQSINKSFITINQQNKIRDVLTKNIYKEELKELYDIKENQKKEFRNIDLDNMLKVTNIDMCDAKIPFIKVTNKKNLLKEFKELRKEVLKSGSFKYAYQEKEVKLKINNLIDKLCENNIDMKQSYNNYIKNVTEISKYFSNDKGNKIINKEKEKLYNLLGNQLLKMMKQENVKVESMIFNLFFVLSKLDEQAEIRANSEEYINSLNNNAKKEYARLMSYSAEDLEM